MSPKHLDQEEYEVLKQTRILETPMIPTRRQAVNAGDSVQSRVQPKQVSVIGINLKPGYSILNFFAIPLTFLLAISFQQDVLSSSLPLLTNKEYFGIKAEKIPAVSNDMQFYPIPFQMIIVLISGFVFDIIGRRKTLFVCFIVAGASAILMPMTTPSVYPGLLMVRIVFSMAAIPIQSNPLVNDYIT